MVCLRFEMKVLDDRGTRVSVSEFLGAVGGKAADTGNALAGDRQEQEQD